MVLSCPEGTFLEVKKRWLPKMGGERQILFEGNINQWRQKADG